MLHVLPTYIHTHLKNLLCLPIAFRSIPSRSDSDYMPGLISFIYSLMQSVSPFLISQPLPSFPAHSRQILSHAFQPS